MIKTFLAGSTRDLEMPSLENDEPIKETVIDLTFAKLATEITKLLDKKIASSILLILWAGFLQIQLIVRECSDLNIGGADLQVEVNVAVYM